MMYDCIAKPNPCDMVKNNPSMKIVPKSRHGWMRMLSLPFIGWLFAVALVYPYWRLHTPGSPGTLGSWALTGPLEMLAGGSFICFIGLTAVAVFQLCAGERKLAIWSGMFAIVALTFGEQLIPPLLR
jgi:hypothetical protein